MSILWSTRDVIRIWLWNDFSFLGIIWGGKLLTIIFRHAWYTKSQRLNSEKGTSSSNPFLFGLGCKSQSLMWTDIGQIKRTPYTTKGTHTHLRDSTEQKFKQLQKHISSLISHRFINVSQEFSRGRFLGRSEDKLYTGKPNAQIIKISARSTL